LVRWLGLPRDETGGLLAMLTDTDTSARPASLWRHRDFLKLWTGQTVSLVGSQVTLLALPLTAVLTLRASPLQMGVLRALQYLPALLIGLFAGVWIDRVRRRPLLIASDLGRALLIGAVPLLAALGALRMGYLYAIAFAVGVLTVLFELAYLAYVPALVQRGRLVDANGRLEASDSFARVVGPGLGGFLVQVLGAPTAMLADALSFLVSVLSLGLIRIREPAPEPARYADIRSQIGEGLRMVVRHPLLRATVVSSGITNFCAAILNSLYVLYVVSELHVSPAALGGIFLAGGAVGLAGAVVAGRTAGRLGLGPALLLGMAFIACGGTAVPLAGSALALALPVLVLGEMLLGAGDAFYNIAVVSLRQSLIPDRLMGRVNASARFVIWGAQPFGAILGGVLGQAIGLRPTLALAAAGVLLALLTVLLSPIRGVRAQPQPIEDEVEA
jgi:predicted MFS family arabinose efflux permease